MPTAAIGASVSQRSWIRLRAIGAHQRADADARHQGAVARRIAVQQVAREGRQQRQIGRAEAATRPRPASARCGCGVGEGVAIAVRDFAQRISRSRAADAAGSAISNRLVSTAPNDTAFSAKHTPSPTIAISAPASDGPITRARLNIIELSAMAWRKSSRPTMSSVIAWRDGMSNALMRPRPNASTMISHTCTMPVERQHRRAGSPAPSTSSASMISIRRRSTRSAIMPPNGAMKNTVTCAQNDVSPSRNGECVRL